MENLTKENFWNEMKEKYPKAMDDFCAWVDEYKKRIGWQTIFHGHVFQTPKYHDLPLAWQVGIFFQYVIERNFRKREMPQSLYSSARENIANEIEDIETTLSKPKTAI